jgi:hypothetical protein
LLPHHLARILPSSSTAPLARPIDKLSANHDRKPYAGRKSWLGVRRPERQETKEMISPDLQSTPNLSIEDILQSIERRCQHHAMRRKPRLRIHMHRSISPFDYGLCWLNGMYLPSHSSIDGERHHSTSPDYANGPTRHYESSIFCIPPFFGPLLFDNTDSDSRDHCANERSLSLYPLPRACEPVPLFPSNPQNLPSTQHSSPTSAYPSTCP